MEEGDVVAQLLQIAEDVGGDQDGVALIPGELIEELQHLVPDDGVQAGGGLVQHQQLRMMAQGRGDGQLHLHAPGEILELLFLRQVEPGEIAGVERAVPPAVGPGEDLPHLEGVEALGEVGLVQHHADVLLHGEELRRGGVRPQDGTDAAVGPQGAPSEGGWRWSCRLRSPPPGRRWCRWAVEGQVLQSEAGEMFGHVR